MASAYHERVQHTPAAIANLPRASFSVPGVLIVNGWMVTDTITRIDLDVDAWTDA